MKSLVLRIVGSSAAVAGILFLCKLMGGVEKVFLGYVYGKGHQAGTYLAAAVIVVLFYDIIRYSLIPALLPVLEQERQERGEEASWRVASTFFNVMLPIIFIGAVCVLIWPGAIARLFIRDPEQAKLGARLLRIMFAGAVFLIAGGITYALLNSYRRFAAPALGDLAFKILAMAPLVIMAVLITINRDKWLAQVQARGTTYIAWGIMAGCAGLFLIQLFALRHKLHHYRPVFDFHNPAVKQVLSAVALPLVYAFFFWGARRWADIWFATSYTETGGPDYYFSIDISYRLVELPFRFIIEPLGYVVFPFLAALALKDDRREFTETLMTTLRGLVLVLLPMGIVLFLLRTVVVQTVFGWGEFSAEMVRATAGPLRWYAWGILALGIDLILVRSYFSMKDALTPTLLEVLAFALQFGTIFLLKRAGVGHVSIAIGFTVSRCIKVALMFGLLKLKTGTLQWQRNLLFALKVGLAGIALGATTYFVSHFLSARVDTTGKLGQLLLLGAPALAGGMVYVLGILALRVGEVRAIIAMLRKRKELKASTENPDQK